jgi:predicted nucleic acid-binding protein
MNARDMLDGDIIILSLNHDPEVQQLIQRIAVAGPIPYSTDVARTASEPRADLHGQGKRVRQRKIDLMIAVVAIHVGLILVTRNQADFADMTRLSLP